MACHPKDSEAGGTGNRLGRDKPDGYLLGSYRIANAPEPNSSRLMSFKSTCFENPPNNVGPWPPSPGCTPNPYSSINPPSVKPPGELHTSPQPPFSRPPPCMLNRPAPKL